MDWNLLLITTVGRWLKYMKADYDYQPCETKTGKRMRGDQKAKTKRGFVA
jgi:hypothetical protein